MIKVITFDDIQPLYKEAKKHQLLMSDKLTYFGYYERRGGRLDIRKLVAFNGYKIRGKKVILDCAYCVPDCRGRGIYTKLHNFRMEYIQNNHDFKVAEVTCTKYSRGLHIKNGAELIHTFKVSGWEKYKYEL